MPVYLKRPMRLAAVALALLIAPLMTAMAAVSDDQAFLRARDAFERKDKAAFTRAAMDARDPVLQPWVDYWSLALRLDDFPTNELRDYLRRHEGAWTAEKLRAEWLRRLGKFSDWENFDAEFPKLARPDMDINCHALRSRWRNGDTQALAQARPMWSDNLEMPESCNQLMDALAASQGFSVDEVWTRLRNLLINGRVTAARPVAAYLPPDQAADVKSFDAVAAKPEKYLERLSADGVTSRPARELVTIALARLARSDPERASALLNRFQNTLGPGESGYVYAVLGWQGAQRHLAAASGWYRAAGDARLTEEQHAWKVRAGLRAGDWKGVANGVQTMRPSQAALPEWTYWLGRALAAEGKRDQARAQFQRISGQAHFYGNLADEELGRPISVPQARAKPADAEVVRIGQSPPIQRSMALLRLELRSEAVQEWNWALRDADDATLLTAAEYAHRNAVFDRAINAAERTRMEHDFSMRFLAPFRDKVELRTRELNLDKAWVYGLMRQESRFVTSARSSAGASGLMQLMPATASWVARKIGLADFRAGQVADLDTNVMLGTSYLKLVLEDLDNHPVLASAAYNAGPNRARRWRDSAPLEGAIYAETIPFNETRDYVKKVMSNAVYYATIFDGKPHSLKERLGTVGPLRTLEPRGEALP